MPIVWKRKILRHKIKILLSFTGLIFCLLWYLQISSFYCSEEESLRVLETVCKWYDDGYIVGNLCPHLCGPEKKVKYKHCTNYKRGKVVLITTCEDVCEPEMTITTVLKSSYPNIHIFEEEIVNVNDIRIFHSMIEESLLSNLGVKLSTPDIIKQIFQEDYMKYLRADNKKDFKALILTVWSLVQQNEYILNKVNEDQTIFPKIYHSCGPFYLVEPAPPGPILNPSFNSKTAPWKDRMKTAVQLLKLVRALEINFHQELHMCDLKGENFGIASDGSIKLIDTDSIHYTDNLLKELGSVERCSSNPDCDYWDCHGVCNASIGKCKQERLNNNLQSLCQDVLAYDIPLLDTALLKSPPRSIASDLKKALNECIRPQSNGEKASETIRNRLEQLLQSTSE